MSYEAQQQRIRNIVVSANKQITYGTALADVNLTRTLRHAPGDFVEHTKEFYSDIARVGKGHPWATLRQAIAEMTALTLNLEVDDFLAGWIAMTLFGKVTTAGTGPYTHTFTFEQATTIAPVTTVWVQDTAALKRKWPDLAAVSLRLSGTERGPLLATLSMVGSGRRSDAASFSVPALPTPVYLQGRDTDILLGPQGAPVSIKERVRAWRIELTSGIVPHRAPGGGLYSSFHKFGEQRVRVSLTVAAKDTDDIETLFLSDTKRELQINTNSGAAAQLNIKIPAIYFGGHRKSVDGIEVVHELEAGEQDVIKESGNLIEWVAINSQATYLVGA